MSNWRRLIVWRSKIMWRIVFGKSISKSRRLFLNFIFLLGIRKMMRKLRVKLVEVWKIAAWLRVQWGWVGKISFLSACVVLLYLGFWLIEISTQLLPSSTFDEKIKISLDKVKTAFLSLPGGRIAKLHDMDKIASACECPVYWRRALFNAVGGHRAGSITSDHFLRFWENVIRNYHDPASRFVAVVSTQRKNYTDIGSRRNDSSNISNVNYKAPPSSEHYLEFKDFFFEYFFRHGVYMPHKAQKKQRNLSLVISCRWFKIS